MSRGGSVSRGYGPGDDYDDDDDGLESVYPESTYSTARHVSRSGNRTRVTISDRPQIASKNKRLSDNPEGLYWTRDLYGEDDYFNGDNLRQSHHWRPSPHRARSDTWLNPELERRSDPWDDYTESRPPKVYSYNNIHDRVQLGKHGYDPGNDKFLDISGRAPAQTRRQPPVPSSSVDTGEYRKKEGEGTAAIYAKFDDARTSRSEPRERQKGILRNRHEKLPRDYPNHVPDYSGELIDVDSRGRSRARVVRFVRRKPNRNGDQSDSSDTTSRGSSIEIEEPTLDHPLPKKLDTFEKLTNNVPIDAPNDSTESAEDDSAKQESDTDISSTELSGSFDTFDFPSLPELQRSSESRLEAADIMITQSPTDNDPKQVHGPFVETDVRISSWQGNALDHDHQEAILTTWAQTPEKSTSHIRWIHLERSLMIFEEFIAVVREVSHARLLNHQRIVQLLRQIQYEHEKQRQYGCDMTFACRSEFNYEGEGIDQRRVGSMVFLCLPFLCFEQYHGNQVRLLPQQSPAHPVRGFVQAHTRTCNDKRELAQAVTSRPGLPTGNCLHVSNLWCLILDEQHIFTCSRLALDILSHDIARIIRPPHDIETPFAQFVIGDTWRWQIPKDHIRNWPSLLALFDNSLIDIEKSGLEIRQKGGLVGREQWNHVLDKSSSPCLDLVRRVDRRDTARGHQEIKFGQAQKLFRSLVRSHRSREKRTAPKDNPSNLAEPLLPGPEQSEFQPKIESLCVFQHGNANQVKSATQLADMMHETMLSTSHKLEKNAYVTCPAGRLEDVLEWTSATRASSSKSRGRARFNSPAAPSEHLEALAVAAVYLVGFFWPFDFEHVMISHFYGALHKLLSSRKRTKSEHAATFYREYNEDDFDVLQDILWEETLPHVVTLTNSFLGNEASMQAGLEKLANAWLRLITALCVAAKGVQSNPRSNDTRYMTLALCHLRVANNELREAELAASVKLSSKELAHYEVCSVRGIAALLIRRLCKGVSRGCPEVVQVYDDYYQQMNDAITRNPFTRSHRERLRDYEQELEALLEILQSQRAVLDLFAESNTELTKQDALPQLPIFYEPRRQDQVVRKAKDEVDYKIDALRALKARAAELGIWHLSQIETNKDQQESAIIIFTIVTIIFLPLSFVASVLGMNTSDIRGMNVNQWVFWVVAIPLTTLVILVSLYWAGFLEEPWKSFLAWLNRSQEHEMTFRAARPYRGPSNQGMDVYSRRPSPIRRRTTYPSW